MILRDPTYGASTYEPGFLQCSRCGGFFHPVFFRARSDQMHMVTRRGSRHFVCIGCEQEARDEEKQRNRWIVKARGTYNRHADKAIAAGMVATRPEFGLRFGWRVDQIAHDLEHAYKNGCCYCWTPFASMANGLADLTLDIVDPEREPYYRTNVKYCDATCNREKQRTPPQLWEVKLQMWERWRDHTQSAWPPGSLFFGT